MLEEVQSSTRREGRIVQISCVFVAFIEKYQNFMLDSNEKERTAQKNIFMYPHKNTCLLVIFIMCECCGRVCKVKTSNSDCSSILSSIRTGIYKGSSFYFVTSAFFCNVLICKFLPTKVKRSMCGRAQQILPKLSLIFPHSLTERQRGRLEPNTTHQLINTH